MKLSFPHMGNIKFVLSDLFDRVGTDYILPPTTTMRTLALGVKHSPEMACLPLKATIGNLIEALEHGADTLVMVGGIGPCRFGYYAEIQRRVLKDLKYDFDMVIIEPPSAGWLGFLSAIKRVAPNASALDTYRAIKISFEKARYFDLLERRVLENRCWQTQPRTMTKAFRQAHLAVAKAKTPTEIRAAYEEASRIIDDVPRDLSRNPLKIGIVGEFYMLLEPFFNFDLEEWLGERGVYLERSVYLTDWISPSHDNIVGGISEEVIKTAAAPYLNHTVGGEGLATVGNTVLFARREFDGVIQLFPFTCMPDTIAKGIIGKVAREMDIPVLSLVVDEQTGKAGVITRLEAFLDLLLARRAKHARRTEVAV